MLLTQCGPTDMCPRTFLRKTKASGRRRLQELISSDACPPAARRRDHMIGWRCLWSPRLITENPKVQRDEMLRQMSARVKLHSRQGTGLMHDERLSIRTVIGAW